MRIFVLILFFLVVHKLCYAQKNSSGPAGANSSTSAYATINRLNSTAHSIFLQSPDSAHQLAAKALILSEKINYTEGKGQSFLNLGLIYWAQSYYPVSLFYLKSALLNLPRNQPLYLSDGHRALGRTYADLKNFNIAFAELDTAQILAGEDPARLAEVYSERANIYTIQGQYDKAIKNVKTSLTLNTIAKADAHIAVLYGRLGTIYLYKKQYAASLAYNNMAFTMAVKTHNRRLRAYTCAEYATIYNGLGRYDDAIKYARKGISLADSLGVIDAQTKAFNELVNSYELKHDYLSALRAQKQYNAIRDSLSNLSKLKTISLVQNYYALDAKINSVKLMAVNEKINQAKIKQQHVMIRVLFVSLIVLMMILTGTYYFYKQKQLLSRKLQLQHKELLDQKQVIEVQADNLQKVSDLKDKLFAVIGHDLRSPMANLSNIIEMFDEEFLTAEEVHDLMKNINPVVKGVELTLSNLVEWAGSQIKGISVKAAHVDIFLMGMEMEQTFLHALQQKNIEFINRAYPGQGAIADENHLKVVLRNLISNAIKFTSGNGTITLSTVIENNELIISVKDSGKGMTPEEVDKLFFINTHFSNSGTSGEKGTGIGLLLCKELVELNGGKLRVRSRIGKGSTFFFNLPLVKAYV